MKRLIILLMIIACMLCSCGPQLSADAESYRYARANAKTAYFFTDKDISTSLFAVPYTYCVEILRDEGDWYYVRYGADTGIYRTIYGYCRKSDFDVVEGTPEVTYLYKAITVTYTTGDDTGSLPVLDEINVEAAFYGTYYSGATAYSYVYCQGSFGYIPGANDDYPLNLPDNEGGGTDEPPPEEEGMNVGLISALVICALAAAAIAMLYFTTRKKINPDA